MIKIFAFGCWNRYDCNTNTDLKNIIADIRQHDEYTCGIILGDNMHVDIYGNIMKKRIPERVHDIRFFRYGLESINDINKPVYGVFGKHDMCECGMILKDVHKLNNWNMPTNCYTKILQEGETIIKIIVYDTNYRDKEYECEELPNNYINQEQMFLFLESELKNSSEYNHVLLCGHVPIASFKIKKESTVYQCIDSILLEKIHELIVKYSITNLIYLCADTHNYQYNTISFLDDNVQFQEIVCGTAGGAPDIFPESCQNQTLNITPSLNITNISFGNPFGYVELCFNGNEFNQAYIRHN